MIQVADERRVWRFAQRVNVFSSRVDLNDDLVSSGLIMRIGVADVHQRSLLLTVHVQLELGQIIVHKVV